jgi:hypothetical protein
MFLQFHCRSRISWLLSWSVALVLAACTSTSTPANVTEISNTPTPAPEPTSTFEIPDTGPILPRSYLPDDLSCADITSLEKGQTWNGLTIGTSTLTEVIAALSPLTPQWDERQAAVRFGASFDDFEAPVRLVLACFSDDMVTAIDVYGGVDLLETPNGAEFDGSVESWVEAFGKPDVVTWGNDYYSRTLIWAESGLLVVISMNYYDPFETGTRHFILLPPMDSDNLGDSWIKNSLPDTETEHSGDLLPFPTQMSGEDPWNIEK